MNLIRKKRIERGLTQNELALLTGLKNSTISNYETGHRKPSIATAFLISSALGVSMDDLFTPENVESNLKEVSR